MTMLQKILFVVLVFLLFPFRIAFQTIGDIGANVALCFYLVRLSDAQAEPSQALKLEGTRILLRWYCSFALLFFSSYFLARFWAILNISEMEIPHYLSRFLGRSLAFENSIILAARIGAAPAHQYLLMTTLPALFYTIIFLLFPNDILFIKREADRIIRTVPYVVSIILFSVLNFCVYIYAFSSPSPGAGRPFSMLKLFFSGDEVQLFVWTSFFMYVAPSVSILILVTVFSHYVSEVKYEREWRSERKNSRHED